VANLQKPEVEEGGPKEQARTDLFLIPLREITKGRVLVGPTKGGVIVKEGNRVGAGSDRRGCRA